MPNKKRSNVKIGQEDTAGADGDRQDEKDLSLVFDGCMKVVVRTARSFGHSESPEPLDLIERLGHWGGSDGAGGVLRPERS